MNKRRYLFRLASLAMIFLLVASSAAFAVSVPRTTVDELNSRLGEENLVVLDVRSPRDWGMSNVKILGSQRVPSGGVSEWAKGYSKEKTIVLYCS